MSGTKFSYDLGSYAPHIWYLQRTELDDQSLRIPANEVKASLNTAFPLWLMKVKGVPRFRQTDLPKESQSAYFTKDVLAGLNGQQIPMYFLIRGEAKRVHLYVGTMANNQENGPAIRAVFNSQYPGVQLYPEKELTGIMDKKEQEKIKKQRQNMQKELQELHSFMTGCQYFSVVTGVPTPNVGEMNKAGTQIDRLIRGLYGTKWGLMVLAEPVEDRTLVEMQFALLREQIRVEQEEGIREWRESAGKIVASYYQKLLKMRYQFLENSLFEGGWWVQSYIFSQEPETYQRAKALVKSIFSGDFSRVDRIRMLDCPDAGSRAANFNSIVVERPPSPGHLHATHKSFKYHTLVSSGQLSALIHLPRTEIPGYYVRESASFDVFSHVPAALNSIEVGEILNQASPTGNPYNVRIEDLTKHCLLVGITGSGKTNTSFHLLQQLQQQDRQIPFLIIEPAKREYRKLAKLLPSGSKLRVFTVGEEGENAAPFRLNPFEIMPGVPVQTHIDLLKSVFNASFGMWSPLPQVLERAIHEIYRDKGWDPVSSTNDRAVIEGSDKWHPRAQPTLTDLYHKVAEMVPKLGYDKEVTRNVRTALETRINSLRIGAKGLMLDTPSSIPIDHLLDEPTVFELEGIGDDDEKAFIMGLILTSLYEYYRVQGSPAGSDLRHITVVEEAHRLLKNVPASTDPEASNLRGKAVETFVNMLSEVRAYGEGFLIAEQIPTKLASDVIKNTALKVMHRTVANDDREVMGGAMNLDKQQVRKVVALGVGEAVVHGGGRYGDDNAILVQVPEAKGEGQSVPTGTEIRKAWEKFRDQHELTAIFQSYPTCRLHCDPPNPHCADARRIAEDPAVEEAFAAFIHSLVLSPLDESELPERVRELYPAVHRTMLPHMTYQGEDSAQMRCTLTHALYHYMEKRGAQYSWKYEDVANMTAQLLPALVAIATGQQVNKDATQALETFCRQYKQQCQRVGPFYGCKQVCGETCLYRYAVEPLAMKLEEDFRVAAGGTNRTESINSLCKYITDQILLPVVHDTSRRQAALCFVIQQVAAWRDYGWEDRRLLVDDMIAYYE